MYSKIPDASGIFANNIIKIKNFFFEFKELNSRLFYGNFYLTSITGDFNRTPKWGKKKRVAFAPLNRRFLRRRP